MRPLRSDGINDELQERPIMDPEVDRRIHRADPAIDAGMAGDPHDADLIGSPPYEEESMADDILPDQIDRFAQAPEPPDEDEYTARPRPEPLETYFIGELPVEE